MSRRRVISCLILISIVGLAAFLRARDISLRPFHSDEGVNFHFMEEMERLGYYPYSHENYHGPSYFYLARFFADCFGENDFGVRASAIIPGVLTLLLLIPLASTEGLTFVLSAAALFAISPSLVFYSRYAIHETLFMFGSLCCGFSIYLWYKRRHPGWLYSAALSTGLLIATKETFIITLASLGVASAALAAAQFRSVVSEVVQRAQDLFYAALLTMVAVALTFTGGFRWSGGLREMLLAVPQWISRNTSDYGHFKPRDYYFNVLVTTEPYLALVPLICLIAAVCFADRLAATKGAVIFSPRFDFGRFSITWFLVSFLIYSQLNYKTPWLIINFTLPGVLALSWLLSELCKQGMHERWAAVIVFGLVLYLAAERTYRYNFAVAYGRQNPFSYVHTTPGLITFTNDLMHYWQNHPEARVLLGIKAYWPLPYYLRDKKNRLAYLNVTDPSHYAKEYSVLVLDRDQHWYEPGWAKKYYRFSEVQESQTYFRRGG